MQIVCWGDICMKCQSVFLGKIRQIISNVVCWNVYPACKALNIHWYLVTFLYSTPSSRPPLTEFVGGKRGGGGGGRGYTVFMLSLRPYIRPSVKFWGILLALLSCNFFVQFQKYTKELLKCQEVILLNTKTCLQQSELYPSQVLHQQFVDLYIEENDYLSGNFFLLQYISHSLRNCTLTLITLWANLDDKSVIFIFIFFFSESRVWHFMQIV